MIGTGSDGSQPFDEDLVTRAAGLLDGFAADLSPQDQAALRILLARVGAAELTSPPGMLSQPELDLIDQLDAEPDPPVGAIAVLTVVMKATRLCNLRCVYCHSWASGPNQTMTFSVLARATHDALRDPGVRHVDFVWHGGEATLLPLSFYRRALWLQDRFRRPGQIVLNSIQTNGTRLSDEWLEFLRNHDFGVGVSLDGPPEVHDARRVDVDGRPTSARVRSGLARLKATGIRRWGALMVVDDAVCAAGPRRILEYLAETGVERVALLNVLPENTPPAEPDAGDYLPLPRFVAFLSEMLEIWWTEFRDRIQIRELADLIAQLRGAAPGICVFAGDCFGSYITVEPTGDVSACDKYIGDATYGFGHVLATGLAGALRSERLAAVRDENRRAVEKMRSCRWFSICNGGCPHDRYTGERHLPGFDGRCCGLAPLLDAIALKLEYAIDGEVQGKRQGGESHAG